METLLERPQIYDADLFSPAALREPFGDYRALRDLGPVARLADPDVYVLARFDAVLDAVRDALRASDALVNGEGVGFSEEFNEDPDRFDVRRDARGQLAWGVGKHACGGMHLARMEMEVMLEALVERCSAIEAGEPEIGAHRGLYGFASLPFALHSAPRAVTAFVPPLKGTSVERSAVCGKRDAA